jgi:hypothetical protein
MADRYWVGGSGSWDATTTTNWSATSGGAGGASAPTSSDNVIFNSASNATLYTVTVGTNAACADMTVAGPLTGNVTFSLGATAVINCYGSFTLPATGATWTGTAGCSLNFRATTTGKTITTNGVTLTLTSVFFNGLGGAWTLGSALTTGTPNQIVSVQSGTFNTGNFNITSASLNVNTVGTQAINLGSSLCTFNGNTPVNFSQTAGLTFNAGTSQITCSATSPTFTGGGLTFYNVSFTSAGNGQTTISGANTFNNLTQTSRSATGRRIFQVQANQTVSGTLTLGAANTAIRRIHVTSETVGIQRTITLNGTLATLADVDFQDIATAGTVGTWTGTRLGNGLGNSGITFDAAKTVYWNLAGTQNWSATAWATTNNGAPAANNFPLAQDTAIFTEAGAAGTVTIDSAWFIGEINMADGVSNRTTAMTLGFTVAAQILILKNVKLFSGLTITGTSGVPVISGQGTTQTITSAGVSFTPSITIVSPSGTVQLLDNLTCSASVTLTQGTLDLNDFDLTCTILSSTNSNTRSIDFGTGDINLTGNAATILSMGTVTGFTYSGTPTVNATYSGSTGTRTINCGVTGVTESNALNLNITAGTDTVALSTNQSIKNLNFTGFAGTLSSANRILYGSLTLSAGMTSTDGTGVTTFASTTAQQNITSNGITLGGPITCSGTQTVQLQDNLTLGSTRTFTLTSGTLDLSSGNRTLSTGLFSSTNSNTRSILFGTGNITVTGNDINVIAIQTATGFTYTGTPTVNCTYSGSTGTRNIAFGTTAGGTEANALNFNISAGSDIVGINSAGTSSAKNINFTGFTGTFASAASIRRWYGNVTFSSGMTVEAGAGVVVFAATSGTQQITTAGKTLDFPITQDGVGGTVQLQDALTMGSTRTLTLTNGTFNANNYNVTTGLFSSSNTNARTLTMGSGTWTIQGTGSAWNLTDPTNLTLNTNTSTISMTSASAKTFQGGSLAYYNLNQGGAGALTIVGNNTFNNITDSSEPSSILFTAGSTQTVSNFTVSGSPSNLITLASTAPGSVWYLTKTSGTVTVTYCDISDSDANGGAAFNCINGVNSGNNTGWNFSSSSFSSGNFLAFF